MKSLEQALMAKQGPLASCQVKEGRFVLGMLRFWDVLYSGNCISGTFILLNLCQSKLIRSKVKKLKTVNAMYQSELQNENTVQVQYLLFTIFNYNL